MHSTVVRILHRLGFLSRRKWEILAKLFDVVVHRICGFPEQVEVSVRYRGFCGGLLRQSRTTANHGVESALHCFLRGVHCFFQRNLWSVQIAVLLPEFCQLLTASEDFGGFRKRGLVGGWLGKQTLGNQVFLLGNAPVEVFDEHCIALCIGALTSENRVVGLTKFR